MSDAATAPAAPAPEQAQPAPPETPEAKGSDASNDGQPAPQKAPSAREALKNAFASVDKQIAGPQEPKTDAKKAETSDDAPKQERERNPDGTFKARDGAEVTPESTDKAAGDDKDEKGAETPKKAEGDQKGFSEAPQRFSADAKAVWKDAPLPVRAEIHRMQTEMEQGIAKFKGDAEAYQQYREFDQNLKQQGQTFQQVFDRYIGIEQQLAENPLAGLDTICRNMGLDLRTVAARVLNQTPDEASAESNRVINELRGQVQDLQKHLSGFTQTYADRQAQEAERVVMEFAAQNPRFEELSGTVFSLMEKGLAKDLQEAFDKAVLWNPAPPPPAGPAPAQTRTTEVPAQTREKTQLSVSGGPAGGSNPQAPNTPSGSTAEALQKAFRAAGIA